MTEPWYLTPSDFLGNLGDADRARFLLMGHRHSYARNAYVFRSGDPGRNVYVLEQGRAKIYKVADAGREVILWFCFPGEIFGLAEATRGGSRDVYAQVCTEAVVHRIPREHFSRFVKERPQVAMQVIDLLSCRLRVLGDILANLAADDASSRIIKLLLRLCSRYGRLDSPCGILGGVTAGDVCLDIPLTHQEMADMLGTSRQTVTTVLGELKRRGVLRSHYRHMHVDPRRLEHLLPESMGL